MAASPKVTLSPEPDPRAGVFETILVFEDRPVELEAHLARLAASARALYDEEIPDLRDLVRDRSRGGGLGRLRLTLEPSPEGLLPTIVVASFDPNNVFPTGAFASKLVTVGVERGYGAHKWADRDMLTRAEAAAGPGSAPLLVDAAGVVLEGARANVFAVRDGRLTTPPLDGEILPGVTRAAVIACSREAGFELAEAPLLLADLRTAEEVFLTGSLRGVEPINGIDGESIPSEGPVTSALAAALRKRWFGS